MSQKGEESDISQKSNFNYNFESVLEKKPQMGFWAF